MEQPLYIGKLYCIWSVNCIAELEKSSSLSLLSTVKVGLCGSLMKNWSRFKSEQSPRITSWFIFSRACFHLTYLKVSLPPPFPASDADRLQPTFGKKDSGAFSVPGSMWNSWNHWNKSSLTVQYTVFLQYCNKLSCFCHFQYAFCMLIASLSWVGVGRGEVALVSLIWTHGVLHE